MIRKIYFLIILFIFVIFGYEVNAQDMKIWTLEECIEYGLANNLTIKRSEFSVTDNEILLRQSKAAYYPTLNAGGQYQNLWGRSIDPTTNLFSTDRIETMGIQGSSSWTLYQGRSIRNSVKQNRVDLQGSEYDLQRVKNDIMLDVTTGFLTLILNTELFENAKVQLETTKAQLETTSKQVRAGALPMSSELDLIAQVESNEVAVINADNDVRLAKLNLQQTMLMPSGEEFDVDIPEIELDILEPVLLSSEQIYQESINIMPQIKSAEKSVESADLGIKIAHGLLEPRVYAQANIYTNYSSVTSSRRYNYDSNGDPIYIEVPLGYYYNPSGIPEPVYTQIQEFETSEGIGPQLNDNISQSVALTLSIPIFNGLQNRTYYQRAKIQSNQARTYSEEAKLALRQSIELAYNNASAASKSYNASLKQVASLEESFRAAEKSYNLGAMNIYDYQVASNNLFRARSDLLRAKYNYIFTVKVLDFYLGKPLSLD
ncbi:TolC family protein [Bacteroidota bacterium]